MPIRFYLLPVDRQTINGADYRGPKYFAWKFNPTGFDDQWSWYDYGSLDWGVLCSNITPAHHTALIAAADVLALPLNLDQNMTAAAVTAARDWLENASLPGNWVTTADTYRSVLRSITNIMRFMIRVDALLGYTIHLDGINLNATISTLSQNFQNRLAQVAEEFGLDYSGVTGSTTLRQLLKGMADQFSTVAVPFGELATL